MSRPDTGKSEEVPTGPRPGPSGETTSLSLLARARANDATAWQRILDLYRPLVLSWCVRQGVRADDAEDVAQEVFTAAAAALPAFRHDRPGDTFRGWLRGITRNQMLMHIRRNQGQPRAEGGSGARLDLENVLEPQPALEDEAAAVSQLYRRALEYVRGEFAERLWQAFWLTAIEERSPADLAGELGMTPAAIRQAKSRVLRRLKQELGELLV
jgi:RNA polymerase sigma-70 factor (ECF subfamily)